MRRKSAVKQLAALAAAALFLLVSCGLETVVALYPIDEDRVEPSSTPGTGISFYHNTNNNDADIQDIFLGYEIFYKFHTLENLAGNIVADRNYFYEQLIFTESGITSRGYIPLYKEPTRTRPFLDFEDSDPNPALVMPLSKGDNIKFEIDFTGLISSQEPVLRIRRSSDAEPNPPYVVFPIRRKPQGSPEEEAPFLPTEILSTDTDVANIPDELLIVGSGNSIYLTFCIVAYGIDIANGFNTVYSEAILLNRTVDEAIIITF